MKIGIIGAGWYGVHLAIALSKQGHEVVLIDKNHDMFFGISGSFGIRTHVGPHYPRSSKTRKSCQKWFKVFCERYKDIIVDHSYSIYAIGKIDADGLPPKVSVGTFKKVCAEAQIVAETENPDELGYRNLWYLADVNEPSLSLGGRLRNRFRSYLAEVNIMTRYNTTVTDVVVKNGKALIFSNDVSLGKFDYVINATSYQSVCPSIPQVKLPFNTKYQCCLAFVYKDEYPKSTKPFSFIVLEGAYPCVMPCVDGEGAINKKYILTHGRWTILGSFDKPDDAYGLLNSLTEEELTIIRKKCELSINLFWPAFENRFKYVGREVAVLAKLVTDVEFRSAVTYLTNKRMIHVVPGKITNVFDVEEEVKGLINSHDVDNIISKEGVTYLKGGVLYSAMEKITTRPRIPSRNTCSIQTYKTLRNLTDNGDAKSKDDFSISYFPKRDRGSYCDNRNSLFSGFYRKHRNSVSGDLTSNKSVEGRVIYNLGKSI